MPTLSAFADEISPDLKEQLRELKKNGIRHFDIRGVWNTNVMDLTQAQLKEVKRAIDGEGVRIAAIGSPIGKSPIDKPAQFELERVAKACDIAQFLGSGFLRVFSFYPAEGGKILDRREEVLSRMAGWAEYVAKSAPAVVLTHENESAIYGELPKGCLEIMERLYGPRFIACYDPANFTAGGVMDPFETAWKPLQKYVGFFHLKDMKADRSMAPCGEGIGEVGRILKDAWDSGYKGFMTIEPHLSKAGQFAGFSGPELFGRAAQAVQKLCAANGIPLD